MTLFPPPRSLPLSEAFPNPCALLPWCPCLLDTAVPCPLGVPLVAPPRLTATSHRGYLYAGLEFGAECYCGHKIQAANVSEAECDMDCKGERGSVCGGVNRLSVYRLQLAQESARRCT